MILPGEVAPAHRHVSSAIRFVLDGEGAYTAVEGEKAFMSPGDFVITANWAPHDHGNPSKKPMLWLDVLDFPRSISSRRRSPSISTRRRSRPTARDGNSLAFYASGVLPDGAPAKLNRSPVINYTYARTRPILERMMKAGEIDKRHGARVHYVNPINGGPVLPTMGANLALFPKGFKGEKYRATDGTIFVCAEGRGTTTVDDKVLEWGPNDVFVVPPWKPYSHTAEQGNSAVLDLRSPVAGSARHLARGHEPALEHEPEKPALGLDPRVASCPAVYPNPMSRGMVRAMRQHRLAANELPRVPPPPNRQKSATKG